MNDILLAKPQLPADWWDVSVGEAHIVRENLIKVFDIKEYELPQVPHLFEYPNPNGFAPLVKLLEDKHKAPVVITNGAKQAIGACLYSLKQMGKTKVGMRSPYWCLLPPLINMHGLDWCAENIDQITNADCYLLLSPNNPDGATLSAAEMTQAAQTLKDKGIPLIHDGAYYSPVYMPYDYPLKTFGDVQIYSISKMFGLSGCRLGYCVIQNPDFYQSVCQYMEAMTVGVSLISQVFLYDLMRRMRAYPTLTQKFEGQSSMDLLAAKRIIKQVDPEVLEVPENMEKVVGMFGWFKVKPKADFVRSKINTIDGALFGAPGFVRMNLAFSVDTMQEIVRRLNSVKEDTTTTPV